MEKKFTIQFGEKLKMHSIKILLKKDIFLKKVSTNHSFLGFFFVKNGCEYWIIQLNFASLVANTSSVSDQNLEHTEV